MRIRHSVLSVLACTVLLGLAACNRVGDDWKSAQSADTAEAYQQFLKQHQDSEFATKAEERIKQLADDREWQATSGVDTRQAYEQFLAQHAQSKWAQEARARLDNFQEVATASAGTVASPAPARTAPATPVTPAVSPPPAPIVAAVAEPKPAAAPPVTAAATKSANKPLRVASVAGTRYAQLGAFSSRERAEQEWKSLHARLGDELGTLQPHYTTGKSGSQLLYRLQVGVASPQQVVDLCSRLKKRSQACIPARG